jgi:carboxypeptidase Taq
MNQHPVYEKLKQRLQKIADLNFSEAVLSWDQQTYMPKNGAAARGRQMATLKGLAHEWFVSPDVGEWLKELSEIGSSQLMDDQTVNVKRIYADYHRKKKYPNDFVEKLAGLCANSFGQWAEAKKSNQFKLFEPSLQKIVEMKREEARFLSGSTADTSKLYNELLEDFEPGLTVDRVDEVFAQVKNQLFPFMKTIFSKSEQNPHAPLLEKHYPKAVQSTVTETLIQQMGFSFDSSRADFAPHPFCTSFGPGDVRITLWSDENFISAMIFAGIHEAGHAQYESVLLTEQNYGLPLGQALSMAFHESQSRFWENNIARSAGYWKSNYPLLQKHFPDQLGTVPVDHFYAAINTVSPTLIRVEADELTYHAHIYIRYQIEKALIEGQIQAKDVPAFWNEQYESHLGIRPSTDREGCLQDVHWSYGAFGYFPTYSLGSFYAAQLQRQMKKDLPNYQSDLESGRLLPMANWLKEKVQSHGRRYTTDELLNRVTGSSLDFSAFMDYAKSKYGKIYNIS